MEPPNEPYVSSACREDRHEECLGGEETSIGWMPCRCACGKHPNPGMATISVKPAGVRAPAGSVPDGGGAVPDIAPPGKLGGECPLLC